MQLLRLLRTARHLRPSQLYGRVWHRLNPAQPDLSRPPSRRAAADSWHGPLLRNTSMLGVDRFRFLNADGRVSTAAEWNDPARDKLWRYNLHYFDDLNAAGATDRVAWHRALIERWVRENPPGFGNAWEPYPTALRLVNWIKWALAGNTLEPGWMHSLAIQARWLRRHIEWHLLGNHLFENAKALVFAGLFFDGPVAGEWLSQGLAILEHELDEQILPDGGHFELSPMYHAIILEGLLDLSQAATLWPGVIPGAMVARWRQTAADMLSWLEGLSHPDGGISFFNDAAQGIAPRFAQLNEYARALGIAAPTEALQCMLRHFVDSGYVRLENADAVALLDVARVGPDYLPGHAHADTLSFELSLFEQRVFVNSGTSQYGAGAERLRQRGTAAHNTVQLNEADSSEVWGGFRVARRARPCGLEIAGDDGVATVTCAHDGYRRLSGGPVHRRRWQLMGQQLTVNDEVTGSFRTAVARYHLHPSVFVGMEGGQGTLTLSDGARLRWSVEGAEARVVESSWHPEFGLSVPNQCIELHFSGPVVRFQLSWG